MFDTAYIPQGIDFKRDLFSNLCEKRMFRAGTQRVSMDMIKKEG